MNKTLKNKIIFSIETYLLRTGFDTIDPLPCLTRHLTVISYAISVLKD